MRRVLAPLLLLAVALPLRTVAAQRIILGGGVSASSARVARSGTTASVLTGPVLGATGGVRFSRFTLEGTYLEGQLSPASGSAGTEEVFAEASVQVRAQLAAGFSVSAGPRARAFIADGGTVRWMRIEARGRYASEVVPGMADADIELWQVLSGEVNAQGGSDGGRGGTVGLTVRLPNSRLALRVAYTADRVAFVNGASEFVDAVEVGLRINTPPLRDK